MCLNGIENIARERAAFSLSAQKFSQGFFWGVIKPRLFNALPDDKILDLTKLKAFANDKLNIAKMTVFLYDRVENIVGKGENAGYQHFLLFSQCFPKPSSLNVGVVW